MAFRSTNGVNGPRPLTVPNVHSAVSQTDANNRHSNGVKRQTFANGTGGGTGENRYDISFKVLMIGSSGVGKTSMLRTLMGEPFQPGTISTIGIDLVKKIFLVDNNRIQLEIWDTAGQEQYYSIVALHFRGAKGFIIAYDVTDTTSFEQIRKYWLRTIDQHMDEPVPVFLAANKIDLANQRQVTAEDGEMLASQQCAHGHFETSSKFAKSVNHLFQKVAESMLATWGAPRRYYEVDGNDEAGSHWSDQKTTVNLREKHGRKVKHKCCNIK